jgi:hypothetical protein
LTQTSQISNNPTGIAGIEAKAKAANLASGNTGPEFPAFSAENLVRNPNPSLGNGAGVADLAVQCL